MSCPTATSPINIDIQKVYGKCDLKCDYNFNYKNSSGTITNRGDYLSVSYDTSTTDTVSYNKSSYSVKEIRIYVPSLHGFNGNRAVGEVIIVHQSNTGSIPLLVCIPIKTNGADTPGSAIINDIIKTAVNLTPSEGETATLNIANFNLNEVVPRKPFISYTATEPYQPCSTADNNFVVFPIVSSTISITNSTLKSLTSIVKMHSYDIKSGTPYFINEKGPGNLNGDDIYIDCQPAGISEETIEISNKSDSSSSGDTSVTSETWFKILISVLILIVVCLANYLTGYFYRNSVFSNKQKGGCGTCMQSPF